MGYKIDMVLVGAADGVRSQTGGGDGRARWPRGALLEVTETETVTETVTETETETVSVSVSVTHTHTHTNANANTQTHEEVGS